MNFIPTDAKHIIKPEFVFENKRKFYEEVIKKSEENEGLVLKKLDTPVPFGSSSCPDIRSWLKVKPNA